MTLIIPHRCRPGRTCLKCAWNVAQGGVPNHAGVTTPKPAARVVSRPAARTNCTHLGADTGERVQCKTCDGKVELKVITCSVHGRCMIGKKSPGLACCLGCPDYAPAGVPRPAAESP